MELAIKITPDEIEALSDALDLADALCENSEYEDRGHRARELNTMRRARKIENRLRAAFLGSLR